MSFGKLLAASKNIFGGDKKIVYRRNKNVYLPKFEPKRNPFMPKPPESNDGAAVNDTPKAVEPADVPKMVKTQKICVPFAPQPSPSRVTSWKDRLNPFRATPADAPVTNAVQTELSLDAVKVLHNDLSDADVEVVPVKSRTVATTTLPRILPGRQSLEFLGERRLEIA